MTTQSSRLNLPRRAIKRPPFADTPPSDDASTVSPPVLDVSPSQTLLSTSPYERSPVTKHKTPLPSPLTTPRQQQQQQQQKEFHSAQPLEITPWALQAMRAAKTSPHNLTNLPKRRTAAQIKRERQQRRCCRTFSPSVNVAFDIDDGEEEDVRGYACVARILVAGDADKEHGDNARLDGAEHLVVTVGDGEQTSQTDACASSSSSSSCPSNPPLSRNSASRHKALRLQLSIPYDLSLDDSGISVLTRSQCSSVVEALTSRCIASDERASNTALRILIQAPISRAVDALTLAAYVTSALQILPSEKDCSSPLALLLSFNASLDTALDIPSCKEDWWWRGRVSLDGMNRVDRWLTSASEADHEEEEEYMYECAYKKPFRDSEDGAIPPRPSGSTIARNDDDDDGTAITCGEQIAVG